MPAIILVGARRPRPEHPAWLPARRWARTRAPPNAPGAPGTAGGGMGERGMMGKMMTPANPGAAGPAAPTPASGSASPSLAGPSAADGMGGMMAPASSGGCAAGGCGSAGAAKTPIYSSLMTLPALTPEKRAEIDALASQQISEGMG